MPLVAVTGVEIVGIDTLNLPAALAGHCNGRVESIKNTVYFSRRVSIVEHIEHQPM